MIVQDLEFLKTPSKEVSLEEGLEIGVSLAKILEECQNGIGLSAPQIGILKQVCVVKADKSPTILINPKIIQKEEPFIFKKEGCLSFPGKFISTLRHNKITVQTGDEQIHEFTNMSAVVAAHEIDHLRGILFTEREIPEKYKSCPCMSGKKFKFCCLPLLTNG